MYSLQKEFGAKGKLSAILMLISALVFLAPSAAFAHAKLLRSLPADGEVLQQSPKAIELDFSGRLQRSGVNSVTVTDQNGNRVDKETIVISEDGRKMLCELEELSPGIFTVEWKGLSADEHVMKGRFTFTIAESSAATRATPAPNTDQIAPENKTPPAQEAGTSWLQSVARWLAYLSMMTLFGGFAFLLLVLKPSLRKSPNLSDAERESAFRQGESRFIGLTWLSLFLIAVSAFASLVLQTSAVLDTNLIEAFAPSRLYQVLTQTGYGAPWILQVGTAFAIFIILLFIRRARRGKDDSVKVELNPNLSLLWAGLIISALMLRALSLTGHARAAEAEYQFAVFSDWLHLVAGGVWVGGLFHLALTLPKILGDFRGLQRLSVLSRLIPRFSRLAVACTILLALTGIYNSWIHLGGVSDLWVAPYGMTLLVKIILFIPMLALGGLNTFILRPKVEKFIGEADYSDENPKTVKDFYRAVMVEAALGVIILFLAAILAFLSPPLRHHHTTTNDGAGKITVAGKLDGGGE
jgi:copper transport protein